MDDRTRYFADVYEQYYDLVYRRCLDELFYNVETAEDVAADVFLALLSYQKIIPAEKVKAWLISTTKNKIREYKRKVVRYGSRESIDEYADIIASPDADNMEEQLSRKANMLDLDNDIINSLRPPERELLKYIRENELTYAEIGERMGLTEAAVTMRVFRLYRKVEKLVAAEVEKIRGYS